MRNEESAGCGNLAKTSQKGQAGITQQQKKKKKQ